MSVVAHSKHYDVGRHRQIGDARACRGELLVSGQADIRKRSKARCFRAIAQQSLAHQSGVGARTVIGDAPLVGKSNFNP